MIKYVCVQTDVFTPLEHSARIRLTIWFEELDFNPSQMLPGWIHTFLYSS